MQHEQYNYKNWLCSVALAGFSLFMGASAHSANLPDKPDILTGGPAGPCDPQTDSADYVAGTDVNGQPVAAADLDKAPVPVPAQMQLPLKARRGAAPAYVLADGKALAPLLNPPPGCAAPQH